MDKQKQIEEMAKCKSCYERFGKCYVKDRANCTDWTRAVSQYEQGCRLILENAVVVSRAEYNDLNDYLIKEIVATRKETAEKFARLVEFHSVSTRDENGREIFTISALGLKEILHEEFGIPYNEICKEFTEVKV